MLTTFDCFVAFMLCMLVSHSTARYGERHTSNFWFGLSMCWVGYAVVLAVRSL